MQFELKDEHIVLMSQLSFEVACDTVYNDKYIPTINEKRPFGNSGVLHSVLEILECACDEDGTFSKQDVEKAELLIIELPVAVSIVLQNHTFQPGVYDVDKYMPAYDNYHRVKNYKTLRGLLEDAQKIAKTESEIEVVESLKRFAMCIIEDNPHEEMKKILLTMQWEHMPDIRKEFPVKLMAIFNK